MDRMISANGEVSMAAFESSPDFGTTIEPRCLRVWRKTRETGGFLTEL